MLLKDVRFSPRGLWTAPATIEAPKGGMLRCHEAVLRRPGLADPRPGMPKTSPWSYNGTYTHTQRLIAGPSDNYIGAEPHNSDVTEYRLRWNGGTQILRPNSGALKFRDSQVKGQRAQGNVYLTTLDGLRKADEANGAVAYRALPPTAAVLVTGVAAGVAVTVDHYVAYRVVVRRTDAAGLITRSAPSGRALTGATTVDKQINLRILLHAGVAAGLNSANYFTFLPEDVVEVYRTLNETTSTPTDELYKVGEVEIDSTDIAAGYVDLTDNCPDAETQGSLYTNPSEGGIEAANTVSPACRALAHFNGSLFAGYTRYPAQLTFGTTFVRTGFAGTGQIGTHRSGATQNISVTNGSFNATVNSTVGLKVGMIIWITNPAWNLTTGYVRVATITNATDIVLSHSWGGATGTEACLFMDSIRISDGTTDRYFPAYSIESVLSSMRDVVPDNELSDGYPLGEGSPVLVDIVDDDTDGVTIYDNAIKRFTITGITGDSELQVWATSGDQYSPVLPEPTVGSGHAVTREDIPNGLAWSNSREPSHMPDTNFEQVGADKEAILALHALQNALLVFKSDGVYKVSGANAASGFRVDELDKNVRILTPYCTAELGNKVLAWADTGVYLCDENGCEHISDKRISDLLHPLEVAIGVGSISAIGAWACSNRRENEFCLSIPAVTDTASGSYMLVYNMDQDGWSSWFTSATLRHGLGLTGGLAVLDGLFVRLERSPNLSGYQPWLDEAISVTISSVTDLEVTINGGSGWTPAVGDVLLRSGVYARVTAVASSTVFTVDLAVTTGAASAHVAYEAVLTPIASTANDPGSLKMWGEGSVVWDSLKGVTQYTMSVTSALSATAVESVRTVATTPATTRAAEAFRFRTPDRHARTSRLYPSIKIRQAGADWSFSALEMSYRPMSSRVRHR